MLTARCPTGSVDIYVLEAESERLVLSLGPQEARRLANILQSGTDDLVVVDRCHLVDVVAGAERAQLAAQLTNATVFAETERSRRDIFMR